MKTGRSQFSLHNKENKTTSTCFVIVMHINNLDPKFIVVSEDNKGTHIYCMIEPDDLLYLQMVSTSHR